LVTDWATFAWLCDVYIARTARGRGLGTWLAQVANDLVLSMGVHRVILATADAHEVYAKAGFAPLLRPDRWMEIDLRSRSDPGDVADN
jgi:GNAT superfamily N-acetyltransferase